MNHFILFGNSIPHGPRSPEGSLLERSRRRRENRRSRAAGLRRDRAQGL